MEKNRDMNINNEEMVTISRAEYEELQAQSERLSELEKQNELLLEAIRLTRQKQFARLLRKHTMTAQNS